MDETFIRQLNRYDWPGNVRELQNCIERSFYTCQGPVLTDPALNFSLFEQLHPKAEITPEVTVLPGTLEELEERNIGLVLESCDGDVNQAAKKLGISRASMYRRLKKFGIQARTMSTR
jgi:transcriptional regulator with PAS, ATPase and Fis domain